MDIDLNAELTRHGIVPKGVVHVGAHEGQEYAIYRDLGIARQVWVEPQPAVFERLVHALPKSEGIVCINAAGGPKHGTAEMHLLEGNDGKSSSLLEPSLHLDRWPEITPGGKISVRVAPLDDLLKERLLAPADYNVLCVDVQGFELEVLKGAENVVGAAQAAVCEVSATPLYKGGCTVGQIDAWFSKRGFVRARTKWSSGISGDAFYVRRERLGLLARARIALLGPPDARPPRSARDWAARTASRQ